MRRKRLRTGKDNPTKTDMIANVFSEHPLDALSPKMISTELGLEIKLVTTIVNRLRNEGVIERVGWGKYRLSIDSNIEEEVLENISEDMYRMTGVILGSAPSGWLNDSNGSGFKNLVNAYARISEIGGDVMAQNILRLAASKSLPDDKVDPLMVSVMEVIRK
ncbi:MAG: hypothetical protein R6V01_04320 [Thermoplasmatota archaeon]